MTPVERLQDQLEQVLSQAMDGQDPRIPEAGKLVWKWWADLHLRRSWHMNGPNPIQFSEIEAYGRLRGVPFGADHIDTILHLDDAYLRMFVERQRRQKEREDDPRKKLPPASQAPMAAGLFDMVFD